MEIPNHFPQVNRSVLSNLQSVSALPQSVRYTCGSASAANVPENTFSPRCAFHSPPQVNRPLFHNPQTANTLP